MSTEVTAAAATIAASLTLAPPETDTADNGGGHSDGETAAVMPGPLTRSKASKITSVSAPANIDAAEKTELVLQPVSDEREIVVTANLANANGMHVQTSHISGETNGVTNTRHMTRARLRSHIASRNAKGERPHEITSCR